jgi:hypothetical protein
MRRFRALLPLALGILVCLSFGPGCSSSSSITITLSPSTTQTVDPGQSLAITATLTNDSSNKGVAWSLTGPGTLTNETLTSVTYVAPTVASANSSATVTATSNANTSVTATLTITISTAILGITPTTLPAATVGAPYTAYISAIGGASGTFTWSITSGSLPAGLSMSPSTTSTVTISGTPTTVGTSDFTIQVVDSASNTASQALAIAVSKPAPLTILTSSLPSGTVNSPYSASLQATGGIEPYTWSITSGTLPVGLAFTPAGLISGTPAASGTSSFTAQVTDSTTPTPQSQTVDLSITINPQTSNNMKLNGNYAFQVSGFDPNGLFLAAGSFFADGNGNITGGVMDTNDPTSVQTDVPFVGTYAIESNNLGMLCFNPSGSTCARTFALAMSADGNSRIIEFDDTTGTGTRDSGVLLKQDPTAFSTAAISGYYAFGFLGEDAKGNRYGLAGEFGADGAGNIPGGQLDSDDAGTLGTAVSFSGTYTAPSSTNGRGTAKLTVSGVTTSYSFYVVSASNLLMMEVDPVSSGNGLVSGPILQQSAYGSFSNGSIVLTSAVETTAKCDSTSAQAQAGILNSVGNGTIGLSADQNCGGTLTQPSGQGSYSVASNGRTTVNIPLSDGSTFAPVLYLVASNEAFLIGTDPGVSFGLVQGQSGGPYSVASLSGTYAGGSLAPLSPAVNNQAGIAVVGSNTLTLTTNISNTSGLSQNQTAQVGYTVTSGGRVALTEGTSTTEILYLISPSQYVGISTDANARVDAYQQ